MEKKVVYGLPPLTKSEKGMNPLRLIITKGDLDEFRCGECNALLFKGLNLEKSVIEVKCRSCGVLLVNNGLGVL